MKFFVGAVLLALLALAIVTVGLGAVATLRMQKPEDIDDLG
ncbi:hypothetical protein [Streptomyces sp. FH025]|nr:hypothetical protein [Streptomyces sp. FH025]